MARVGRASNRVPRKHKRQRGRLRNRERAYAGGAVGDGVGVKRYRAITGQGAAIGDRGAGIHCNTGKRENMTFKCGGSSQCGGTSDLPEYVAVRAGVAHHDR